MRQRKRLCNESKGLYSGHRGGRDNVVVREKAIREDCSVDKPEDQHLHDPGSKSSGLTPAHIMNIL